MKTLVVVAGIVVLIIGLGVLAYGIYYPTNKTTSTQIVPQSKRSVDANGLWSFGLNLNNGETINGTAQILSYNQTAGPIFLYVQNESAFIYWGGCAPCSLPSSGYNNLENYTLPSNGVKAFSWTAPYAGAFYFVFDNENYNQNANASLAVSETSVSSSTGNSTLFFAGLSVAVVGVIIAVAGASMGGLVKPPKPAATTTTQQKPSTPTVST